VKSIVGKDEFERIYILYFQIPLDWKYMKRENLSDDHPDVI
jgi:hypothetical protein